jgi:predicted nucleotidyltransferase component of viral defense system
MKLLGTEKAPLFEKEIHLWAYPVESIFAEKLETAIARADQNSRMKDYHDLILLVRGDVVDKKAVKAAIKATFTNRGANLQKLSIPQDQIENIQRYWGIYLKALNAEIQKDLATDIQTVMDEINKFLEDGIL